MKNVRAQQINHKHLNLRACSNNLYNFVFHCGMRIWNKNKCSIYLFFTHNRCQGISDL